MSKKVKVLIIVMALVIVGLVSFVVVDKFVLNKEKDASKENTTENVAKENNQSGNSIFNEDVEYTEEVSDGINGKVAIIKEGEKIFKSEEKDSYFVYEDNFGNKYNIKKIADIKSKYDRISKDDQIALYKATIVYYDENDNTKNFDAAVMVTVDSNKSVRVVAPYEEYTGSTEFLKKFTDMYDDGEPDETTGDLNEYYGIANEAIKKELKSRRFIAKNGLDIDGCEKPKFMKITSKDDPMYLVHVNHAQDEEGNRSTYFLVRYNGEQVIFEKILQHKYDYDVFVDTKNNFMKAELEYHFYKRTYYISYRENCIKDTKYFGMKYEDENKNNAIYYEGEGNEVSEQRYKNAINVMEVDCKLVNYEDKAVELNDKNIDSFVK